MKKTLTGDEKNVAEEARSKGYLALEMCTYTSETFFYWFVRHHVLFSCVFDARSKCIRGVVIEREVVGGVKGRSK